MDIKFKDKQIFYKYFFHEMSGEIMKCMFLVSEKTNPDLFYSLKSMKKIFCMYRNIFDNKIDGLEEIFEMIKDKSSLVNVHQNTDYEMDTKYIILAFLYFYARLNTVINIYDKHISIQQNYKNYEKILEDFQTLNVKNVKIHNENDLVIFDILKNNVAQL